MTDRAPIAPAAGIPAPRWAVGAWLAVGAMLVLLFYRIADLLLVAKIKRAENRIGVVANRVRKNTLMFHALMRFLEKLDIPVIATVRDSQNYVRAAEQGVGIHEMKSYTVKEDLAQWETLLAWLEPERVLTEQPAPMLEQPAPEAVPGTAEAVVDSNTDETGAHDARFVITGG